MMTFSKCIGKIKDLLKSVPGSAFIAAFVGGLLAHMIVITNNWPNHDGLASEYFDQNMITSGRWFLGTACGISSYFAVPWVIGLLAILYLAFSAAVTASVLELKSKAAAVFTGLLMASFPALASGFAYIFTMDGYLLGLLCGVLAVYFTKKYKFGFIEGMVLLAFSLGSYQAYLPVVIILCMYCVCIIFAEEGKTKDKILKSLKFLYMGAGGAVIYYVVLKIMLLIQGKTLDTYQGINEGLGAGSSGFGIVGMYKDFAAFTFKSGVFVPNVFAAAALGLITAAFVVTLIGISVKNGWLKKVWIYLIAVIFCCIYPAAMNIVMFVSGDVTYHAIMRFQWVMIPIGMIAFCDRFGEIFSADKESKKDVFLSWIVAVGAAVLVFCYVLTDNIGYTNLQKKYERTYAYCERLLDRIEQTEGYYPGIPVAMIGVVSTDQYPEADLTGSVTSGLIGLNGDYLLYKNRDYGYFIKYYLGAELNIIEGEEIDKIYHSPEYIEMDSFPGRNSVRVVDGVMYVKTENIDTGLRSLSNYAEEYLDKQE